MKDGRTDDIPNHVDRISIFVKSAGQILQNIYLPEKAGMTAKLGTLLSLPFLPS